MVSPGVGDLEVGGVVDLIKEAVCALVPGLWRLTVGCRTIGKAVMDLGPAINADAAAMAPKINTIGFLFQVIVKISFKYWCKSFGIFQCTHNEEVCAYTPSTHCKYLFFLKKFSMN